MSKKVISLALACLLAHLAVCVKSASAAATQGAGQVPSKQNQQADQIKRKVEDLGVSTRVTVVLRDGQERYGSIAQIDDDSFQILEIDQRRLITIAYKDAKKVRFDYGNPNPFNGKRWNPKWGRIALIGLGAFLLIVIPLTVPRT